MFLGIIWKVKESVSGRIIITWTACLHTSGRRTVESSLSILIEWTLAEDVKEARLDGRDERPRKAGRLGRRTGSHLVNFQANRGARSLLDLGQNLHIALRLSGYGRTVPTGSSDCAAL